MKRTVFIVYVTSLAIFLFSTCKKEELGTESSSPFEAYTITPDGGSYTFDCGITLNVPEGAVDTDTDIQLRKLGSFDIQEVLEPLGREPEDILAGFEIKPDDLTFTKDLVVSIQNVGLKPGDFVIVHELDMENKKYSIPKFSSQVDPTADQIDISLRHFCGISVEIPPELERPFCETNPEHCRCQGSYAQQSSDKDIICESGACQKTKSELIAVFPACGFTETHLVYELTAGCKPEINLTAGSTLVSPGGNTTISAEVILACEEMNNQVVDFSLSDLSFGSLSETSVTTGTDGKAQTIFTAGESEGKVTVTVNATVSYYMSYQETIGEAGIEITKGPLKTFPVTAELEIEIVDNSWAGKFTASFSGCNSLLCLQKYAVTIDFNIDILDEPAAGESWDAGWMGEAKIVQSGTVTSNVEELWVANLYMPSPYTEIMMGSLDKETNEIAFELLSVILWGYFEGDLNYEGGTFMSFFSTGFLETINDEGVGIYPMFNVVLEGDEVTKNGQCMINLLGEPDYIWGPYSLTLTKHRTE